jgi:sigma-B regulation protein RsbU (phosphoserine phosphatase)
VKVLIAEDDGIARRLLELTIGKLGHEAIVAVDGIQAWELFERESPAIVISDWMMPELDGLTLCRRVRADTARYTYFILLTALRGKGRYLAGMAAGADEFMTKPFDPDELAARLRVAERVLSLQREVHQLEGLLPICAYCKKIRDAEQRWTPIEEYIHARTDASFSHGVCPECYQLVVAREMGT